MKGKKVYDIIFPIWLILFFPPYIFLFLAANFAIDSIVLIICFYAFKIVQKEQVELKRFYWKNIFKVWLYGFLSDIIGVVLLFTILPFLVDLAYLLIGDYTSPGYSAAANAIRFSTFIIAMLLSSCFIYLFGFKITFKNITDQKLKKQLALSIALITMPWTFLLQNNT
ncbi:MAG: hypothetical protein WCP73_07280 [Eubacteriales bacterium]